MAIQDDLKHRVDRDVRFLIRSLETVVAGHDTFEQTRLYLDFLVCMNEWQEKVRPKALDDQLLLELQEGG